MGFKIFQTEQQSSIGTALWKACEANALPMAAASFRNLAQLRLELEKFQPSVIVHSQLYDPQSADMDHLAVCQALAEYCRDQNAVLIHLSPHEVFGAAQAHSAASERDRPEPDTPSGHKFYSAEQALLSCDHKLIVRIPWLLDGDDGLLGRLCGALLYSGECVVSDSWRGSPVLVEDVVRLVLAMIQQICCGADNWGFFHLHASDHCSEAELADHVARILQKAGYSVSPILIGPLDSRFVPANGWLKGQRCTNNFGFQYRSWRQGVRTKVYEWLEAEVAAGHLPPPPQHQE